MSEAKIEILPRNYNDCKDDNFLIGIDMIDEMPDSFIEETPDYIAMILFRDEASDWKIKHSYAFDERDEDLFVAAVERVFSEDAFYTTIDSYAMLIDELDGITLNDIREKIELKHIEYLTKFEYYRITYNILIVPRDVYDIMKEEAEEITIPVTTYVSVLIDFHWKETEYELDRKIEINKNIGKVANEINTSGEVEIIRLDKDTIAKLKHIASYCDNPKSISSVVEAMLKVIEDNYDEHKALDRKYSDLKFRYDYVNLKNNINRNVFSKIKHHFLYVFSRRYRNKFKLRSFMANIF